MMKNRHVCDCSHVLLSLLGGELYVNQIINQTGLYKDHVRNDIRILHEAELIEEKEINQYVQGMKRIKRLTKLGTELVTLKRDADMFQKYFGVLQSKVHTIIDLTKKDPNIVKKILKNWQWTTNDIDNYPEWAQSAQELLGYTLRLFTDALIVRYTKIISRFNLNELAKSMLIKVVTDALAGYLLSRPSKRCLNCGAINIDETHIFHEFNPGVFDLIGDFDLTNKFADSEIKDLLKSSILMMAPPRKYLEQKIEEENNVITQIPNEPNIYLCNERIKFYKEILNLN
jgi:hypothetical protein